MHPVLKRFDTGDFGLARGGIASLLRGLPAVWTEARKRGHPLTEVARWMAHAPARQAGLIHKGEIALAADADFCEFAPDEAFVVDATRLHHKNPVSAYHGRPLAGTVRSTWLGEVRIDPDREPGGRLLSRGQ